MPFEAGQDIVMAARVELGVLEPHLCGVSGDPFTAEGRELIAIAERAYGIGAVLEPPPVEGPPVATTGVRVAHLAVVLGGTAAVITLLFVAVVLFARRRNAKP